MLSQRGKARPLEELAEPAEPDEQDAGEVEAEDAGEHGEASGEVKGLGTSFSLGMSVKIMRVMMARFLKVKLMIMLLRMGMGRLVMAC